MKTYSYEDIRKMRKGTNAYEVFEFPFLPEVKIAIRVLTQGEILECLDLGRNNAIETLKRPRDIDAYQYGVIHLLTKSVYKLPEGNTLEEQFFSGIEDVLELSREEVEKLQEFYETVQEKFSPTTKLETPEEFNKLIEDVKKNKTFGNSLSSLMLRKLVGYLIQSLETLQNDNGPGSSQGETSKKTPKKEKQMEVQELE